MNKGTVKFFNDAKGFGFITNEDGKDIFVHANDLKGLKITEGDKVSFDTTDGKKGPMAVDIKLL